ncbi:uncharacterized protein METZ01_LOCUS156397 [marine metagenome]|uniref:SAM-dependent MTase RsmB/NOP-type domain-containing protein n=1 Tax=marine metagenome TaxID=408172 RepID=A0A382AR78_9ZZZZ
MQLTRYRSIISEWDRFQDAISRRDPTTLRVRTGRVSREDIAERLRAQGFTLERVEGLPDFLRVLGGPHSVADTVENWLGLFYVQQASTGVAAPALGARPGERILDLCAAPGGKTTHIADTMEDDGCIVAVDRNASRIRALLGNLYRTAHPNVLVVSGDSRSLPDGALFDRVLVDAPCSAEGTLRRKGGQPREQSAKFRNQVPRRQEALLRRAVALTRPGGVVLYSTCTFAPEENEAVVDRVLSTEDVVLEPINLEVPHAPGLTRFEGQTYDTQMEGACRIYPHHLDSGGFFMARFRRIDGGLPENAGEMPGWTTIPTVFPDGRNEPEEVAKTIGEGIERLKQHFGVGPGALKDFQWMARGRDLWVHRCGAWPLDSWGESDRWKVVAVGLRAMTPDYRDRPRPTNHLLRLLENAVMSKLVALSTHQWAELLAGEDVAVPGVESGFVPLGLMNQVAGRGLVRGGRVRYEIPKVQARWLQRILELRSKAPSSKDVCGDGSGE